MTASSSGGLQDPVPGQGSTAPSRAAGARSTDPGADRGQGRLRDTGG